MSGVYLFQQQFQGQIELCSADRCCVMSLISVRVEGYILKSLFSYTVSSNSMKINKNAF